MNSLALFRSLAKTLSLALTIAVAPAALSAQSVQSQTIPFDTMYAASEGLIRYDIYAIVASLGSSLAEVMDPPPGWDDPPPPPHQFVKYRRVFLYTDAHKWWSPRGLFPPRRISRDEAIAKGANQAAIQDAMAVPEFLFITFFESSAFYGEGPLRIIPDAHRRKGTVIFNVTVPSHPGNQWVLMATSSLGESRAHALQLVPGKHQITITNIEAGNVLVGLYAADQGGVISTYFQEVCALVRKNGDPSGPAVINMEFAEQHSPDRYRIAYLGAGHNSQNDRADLPLQSGREAMVRAMVYDAWGNGGQLGQDQKLRVEWTSPNGGSGSKIFTSRASGFHAESGLIFKPGEIDPARFEALGLGPKIPGEQIQPPHIDITLSILVQPSANQDFSGLGLGPPSYLVTATKTVRMEVVEPREIYIKGYDFTSPQENGWEYVNDLGYINNRLFPFTDDAFPYANFDYDYERSEQLSPLTGGINLSGALNVMTGLLGDPTMDMHAKNVTLHLGFTHTMGSNNMSSAVGLANIGKRAMAVNVSEYPDGIRTERDPDEISLFVSHEMGHCFNLEHAPSEGAGNTDGDYPYGGGGLAGGWGYTTHTDRFFAEDSHSYGATYSGKAKDWLTCYWDIMAYATRRTQFSDHNVKKLIPRNMHDATASAPGIHQIPGTWLYPGTQTWVFGPEAAMAAEEAWGLGGSSSDPDIDQMDSGPDLGVVWGEGSEMAAWVTPGGAFDLDGYMQYLITNNMPLPSVIFTVLPNLSDPAEVSCDLDGR
jgi:hypothetical protein